jgi:hypothetical protein
MKAPTTKNKLKARVRPMVEGSPREERSESKGERAAEIKAGLAYKRKHGIPGVAPKKRGK